MEIVIDIGEYVVSQSEIDILKIYGISSCIGLVMHCPKKKITGVAHILLPTSAINPELGKISPGYFADTAVPAMLSKMALKYNCQKRDIITSIYGGAESKTENDVFNVGSRNIVAVKNKIYEYGLTLKTADVGGKVGRTLYVRAATGEVTLNKQNFL
ncbi:MAG: chemotaxis protein CheD [Eubacteriales bacterium]|jgi:chemotaxis protein CheD|nr:chemotaxis protein CheD [Eubacteriales bacterium]